MKLLCYKLKDNKISKSFNRKILIIKYLEMLNQINI